MGMPSDQKSGDAGPDEVVDVDVVGGVPQRESQFVGLSKEELAQFENDPFWKKIRLGLFIGFWAIWCILLVAAILILVYTPPCPETRRVNFAVAKTGYAVHLKGFLDGYLKGAQLKEQLTGLADKLPYIRNSYFGYVVMYSDELLSENIIKDEVEKSLQQLRSKADELKLELVIHLDSKALCASAHDDAEKCQKKLRDTVESFTYQYEFDGVHLIQKDGDNADGFEPKAINETHQQLQKIEKRSLRERALLVDAVNPNEISADMKISKKLTGVDSTSNANQIADLIRQSKGSNSFLIDDLIRSRVADKGMNTQLALHLLYLLPNGHMVNYGMETYIEKCGGYPLMPWNSTTTDSTCTGATKEHTVNRVSAIGYPDSPYESIKQLSWLRGNHSLFSFGQMHGLSTAGSEHLIYWQIRYHLYPVYIVAINIDPHESATLPLKALRSNSIDDGECKFRVIYRSNTTDLKINQTVMCSRNVHMAASSVVVLQSSFVHTNEDTS